jgi:hypothetical protein
MRKLKLTRVVKCQIGGEGGGGRGGGEKEEDDEESMYVHN